MFHGSKGFWRLVMFCRPFRPTFDDPVYQALSKDRFRVSRDPLGTELERSLTSGFPVTGAFQEKTSNVFGAGGSLLQSFRHVQVSQNPHGAINIGLLSPS